LFFHGYKTRSFIFRKKQRLEVFEKRVLRNLLGPERDEVTGDWRGLHNENLIQYWSAVKSRRMGWARHVACVRHRRGSQRVLVVRRDRHRPLAKSRRSSKDIIKTDLEEIQLECAMDLYDSGWAQVTSGVNAIMYNRLS
jgi:hypothetical protein